MPGFWHRTRTVGQTPVDFFAHEFASAALVQHAAHGYYSHLGSALNLGRVLCVKSRPASRSGFGATVALLHRRTKTVLLRDRMDKVLHVHSKPIPKKKLLLRITVSTIIPAPDFRTWSRRRLLLEDHVLGQSAVACRTDDLVVPLRALLRDLRNLSHGLDRSDITSGFLVDEPRLRIPSHGDLNLTNLVISSRGGAIAIDWDEVGFRAPWFDAVILMARVAEWDGKLATQIESEALAVMHPNPSPIPNDWRTRVIETAWEQGRLTDNGLTASHQNWAGPNAFE